MTAISREDRMRAAWVGARTHALRHAHACPLYTVRSDDEVFEFALERVGNGYRVTCDDSVVEEPA